MSLSETLGAPLIKGETPIKEREILFNKFRTGEIKCLVVSKVANFSIDYLMQQLQFRYQAHLEAVKKRHSA